MDGRAEIRKLEHEAETRLAALQRTARPVVLAVSGGSSADGMSAFGDAAVCESLAQELERVLKSLDAALMRYEMAEGSVGAIQAFQQHRARLRNLERELTRSRSELSAAKARAALLAPRTSANPFDPSVEAGQSDALLRERGALLSADRATDEILQQAAATRDSIHGQNVVLSRVAQSLSAMEGRFGGIGGVLGRIQRHRQKDCIILSFVISFCLLFLMWWLFA